MRVCQSSKHLIISQSSCDAYFHSGGETDKVGDEMEQESLVLLQPCSLHRHQHRSPPTSVLQVRAVWLQPCAAPSGEYESSSPEHLTHHITVASESAQLTLSLY